MTELTPLQKVMLDKAMETQIAQASKGPQRGPNIIPGEVWAQEFKKIRKILKMEDSNGK